MFDSKLGSILMFDLDLGLISTKILCNRALGSQVRRIHVLFDPLFHCSGLSANNFCRMYDTNSNSRVPFRS